jgi:hypothetical protein
MLALPSIIPFLDLSVKVLGIGMDVNSFWLLAFGF